MTVEHGDTETDIARVVGDVWATLEPAAAAYLAGGRPVPARPSRRRRRTVAVTVALLAAGVGGSAAAVAVLGSSAPPPVRDSLSSVDEGLPADLRLHPDVTHARSVAVAGTAVLYVAELPDGGYCTEVAVSGRPKGAVCRTASESVRSTLDVTIPGTPEDSADALVTVAGRVSVPADSVELRTSRDDRVPVEISEGGFFMVQLNRAQSVAARSGLRIDATRAGRPVASRDLSTAFAPETGALDPIGVEMVSAPGDLTAVSRFSGTVQAAGATTVRLTYPDGTTQDAVIGQDGAYEVAVSAGRQGEFADRPGRLAAIDGRGAELASRTVAAVSYWRRVERGG